MGCDIHGPWVMTRVEGSYARCVAELSWVRDYAVFALVANVRNEGGEFEPIDEPRGFPDDAWLGMAKYRLDEHMDNGDCHSASWLSTYEVIEAQRRYVQADDDPTPSSDLMHAIMFMRGYEQEWKTKGVAGEVRLVFCFDN